MENEALNYALIVLGHLLNQVAQPWIIIGTSSLYLQGYPVKPKDIDILCADDSVATIEQQLFEYKILQQKNVDQSKFRSVFSKYNIAGIQIELMGNLEVYTTNQWINVLSQLKVVEDILFQDVAFKVPSKTDQKKIYELFGREKDKRTLAIIGDLQNNKIHL